ncbi:Fhs [Desulforapulum autotrophicum HRM2]|uniref:Formate--tetrahydrofolate ligase n=1 Tax=Desulforapulum autotrophicum (strain ATCC 43914 / DSM 3382 / VKM B-1955 / HRM2) TaxID=177437 RepID=FTHS_DESAH|nr:formate--tetrahydrofolate ligase [Desulforapulum autotrophicum]C0QAX9.1 RecName: Full=Formate--tetrahydrofolate ligase; AltName: Full=Formyltetrahydrofolate synthetase; Short=FHS; Short=FTHFS [Desulforapulum autotrophicum HRM2]ACN14778.1 Fhs [Desulforapulum autotrophicum HRM2]
MALDPTKHADWEIAQDAEKDMLTIYEIGEKLGLTKEELLPQGHYIAKIDFRAVLARLKDKPDGKYIDVTAITPTPLGEGKSTSSMGLVQGLGKLGKSVCAAIRQPSGGPTMNIKGSAAGGGLAQCIPLTPFSLGFTGDINAIMNAHNLAMVALTSRMQHERNYTDEQLERLSGMKRIDIDPTRVEMGWIMDFCCQSLRNIIIGIDGVNGKSDGYMMKSKFGIAVSSEVMAILAVAKDLKDMRERMGKIVVAYTKKGKPVTTEDLQVAGAMTAWMVDALNPSLIQTLEGQPVLVHAGPFANIAIGQSSIIADRVGLKLADYHVTESGFGADIGFEKFWNLKCRFSGLKPDCAVIVATIRALKCHGGAPVPVPGKPMPEEYNTESVEWVEKGCANLLHHIRNVRKAGISPVVCINAFYSDTDAEIAKVRELSEAEGARVALSRHWEKGGDGAIEFAETVIEACEEETEFKFLYELDMPLKERIELIAKEVYGADGVDYSNEANASLARIQADPELAKLGMCMVKTHLSLSDNPSLKGVPTGWRLMIREVLTYGGAGFIVPVAGTISLMPGTGSNPAFKRVDVDCETGKVEGVF